MFCLYNSVIIQIFISNAVIQIMLGKMPLYGPLGTAGPSEAWGKIPI